MAMITGYGQFFTNFNIFIGLKNLIQHFLPEIRLKNRLVAVLPYNFYWSLDNFVSKV